MNATSILKDTFSAGEPFLDFFMRIAPVFIWNLVQMRLRARTPPPSSSSSAPPTM